MHFVGLIYALSRVIVSLCNQEKRTKWLVNLADVITWRVCYKTYKQNHAIYHWNFYQTSLTTSQISERLAEVVLEWFIR